MTHPPSPFRFDPHIHHSLLEFSTTYDELGSKDDVKDNIKDNAKAISKLAHKLYAQKGQSLLIVLQGMDTSGKDGTTEALFHRTPPLNVRTAAFKSPTKKELGHDFLWRVHQQVPEKGEIVVFNRSHYEDVLIVKVRNFVPAEAIPPRYGHINNFERLLSDSGTHILKFMLHISHEIQGERLRERLVEPHKFWKFNPGDLDDRKLWPDYMQAYEDLLVRTSTDHAPWFVIPSDDRRTREALISNIVRETLENMDLAYPDAEFDLKDYDI